METTYSDKIDVNAMIRSARKHLRECIQKLFYKYKEIENQKLLYHYTDSEALLNGIIVPNPNPEEEICLRATRWTHLNDKEEIESGLKLIGEDTTERLKFLSDGLRKYHDSSCSLSFCKSEDNLPMWGMYGKNGSGVMLAFDTRVLQSMFGFHLLPCIYEGSDYDNEVVNMLSALDLGDGFNSLNNDEKLYLSFILSAVFVSLRKNAAFTFEDEVRIIGLGNPHFGLPKTTQYRISRGVITPYVNVSLPKSALKEVWLGPTNNIELAKASTEEFLQSRGFYDVKVKISQVPYRG